MTGFITIHGKISDRQDYNSGVFQKIQKAKLSTQTLRSW